MQVCVSLVCLVPMKSRGVAGSHESLPHVMWVLEIKPSLLEEHPVLLIAEPSPQLQAVFFLLTAMLDGFHVPVSPIGPKPYFI